MRCSLGRRAHRRCSARRLLPSVSTRPVASGRPRTSSSAPLGEDDVVGDQHVVGVELVGVEEVHRSDVAQALPASARRRARPPRARACARTRPASSGDGGLGRRRVALDQAADHVDPAVAGPVGEGAAQGGGLHLLRRPLGVVARLRAVDDATAGELRRAGRALAGPAGALLAVRLAATTADLAAGLGACACPGGRRPAGRRRPGGSAGC